MPANGFLPDADLEVVQGSGANAIRLTHPTAAIFRRMRSDAAKEGITLTLVASYRGAAGYRSWATQLDMRAHPSLYNIGKGFGLPGLPSEHGWGTCMDIDQGLAWVKDNGHRYGVTFPIASDHNHARYDGITMAGESGVPVGAEKQKEDNMLRWYLRDDGNVSFADQYTVIDFGDSNRVAIVAAKLCPDQAEPIKITSHEDAIMREECNKRLAAFRPPAIDLDALAAKIAPLVGAGGGPSAFSFTGTATPTE
jgi:hypothetical protein